jgi:hypothetical protein
MKSDLRRNSASIEGVAQRRRIDATAAIAIAELDLFVPVLHCLCFL